MAVHTCCWHLFLVTQSSKAAPGLQMHLVSEVPARMHETVLQVVYGSKAMSKVLLSAGALWCAERRQLWRESVSQAHLHLGSGSRQHSARVAQAPARLPLLSAHHQPARQCAGDHGMHCPHGSGMPAFANLACSTYALVYALLSLLGLLVGHIAHCKIPKLVEMQKTSPLGVKLMRSQVLYRAAQRGLYSTAAEEQA